MHMYSACHVASLSQYVYTYHPVSLVPTLYFVGNPLPAIFNSDNRLLVITFDQSCTYMYYLL